MQNPTSLDKWFQNHKEKRKNTQVIEEGLLKGSLSSYYLYRLRYFLVRILLSAIIFSIEIRILIEGFGQQFFTQSLGARTLVLLLTAFWWAGLELMRGDIRLHKREDKPYIIPQIILSWRSMAGYLTLAIASISTLLLGLWSIIDPTTLFSAFGFYIITLIARILVDIPLRTYHSCVYATMRIYRPLYWIVATELVAFAMFLILKPTIGAWSVGVSSLISLALSSAISYHYITQTYRFLGYDRSVALAKSKKEHKSFLPPIKAFIKQATPLTIFRLDAVLVLLLIIGGIATQTTSSDPQQTYYQLVLIALCMPLLYGAQEWSMLLYFDYKKLEVRMFEKLRKKFTSGLKYLIVIIAIALWLLLPLLQWVAGQGWHMPPTSILLLLITSSYLGQQAIRVFSIGSNKELMFWGASLLIFLSTFLVLGSGYSLDIKLTWISIILLGHAIGLNIFAKDYSLDPEKILIPPTTWLKILKRTNMPWGGLIRIVLPDAKELDNTKFVIREAAKGLRRSFPKPIYMTNLTRTGLLFFGPGKSLLDANYPTDYESLYSLLRKTIVPLLPESLERMIILPITLDNDEFVRNLSEGETKLKACLFKEEPKPQHPDTLKSFDFEKNKEDISVEDARQILSSAIRYHMNMDARGDKMAQNWEVACEEKLGVIVKIHAIPKQKRNGISRWLHEITRVNLWRAWQEEGDGSQIKKIIAEYDSKP
jgi:hypothetical protein